MASFTIKVKDVKGQKARASFQLQTNGFKPVKKAEEMSAAQAYLLAMAIALHKMGIPALLDAYHEAVCDSEAGANETKH